MAQVYVSAPKSPVEEPEKQLKGFEKVMLQPGETKHVSIDLNPRAFAYYDVAAKEWKIAPGIFKVLAGDSSVALPLADNVAISEKAAMGAGAD